MTHTHPPPIMSRYEVSDPWLLSTLHLCIFLPLSDCISLKQRNFNWNKFKITFTPVLVSSSLQDQHSTQCQTKMRLVVSVVSFITCNQSHIYVNVCKDLKLSSVEHDFGPNTKPISRIQSVCFQIVNWHRLCLITSSITTKQMCGSWSSNCLHSCCNTISEFRTFYTFPPWSLSWFRSQLFQNWNILCFFPPQCPLFSRCALSGSVVPWIFQYWPALSWEKLSHWMKYQSSHQMIIDFTCWETGSKIPLEPKRGTKSFYCYLSSGRSCKYLIHIKIFCSSIW